MSMSPRHALVLIASLVLAACGGSSGGSGGPTELGLGQPPTQVLVVTNLDDAGPGSLRQAVIDAPPGAWITFDEALGTGVVNLASEIEIDKVLTIGGLSGTGGRHALRAVANNRIFFMEEGALQLNDLHLELGDAQYGGAINAYQAHLILWRVTFDACHADAGGGAIYAEFSPIEINDCYFAGNASQGDAGAVYVLDCETRIERTSFYDNDSSDSGGAILVEGGNATLVNSTLHVNRATAPHADGGAIKVYAAPSSQPALLRVFNTTITDNFTGDLAGGIHVEGAGGVQADLELHRSIVAHNAFVAAPDIGLDGAASASGSYNLIGVGGGAFFDGLDDNTVGDIVVVADPMLLALFFLPDGRPVAFPLPASPVVDAVPAGMNPNPEGIPMIVDLRLQPRNPAQPSDLGAIELGP